MVGSELSLRALRHDDPDDPAWSSGVTVDRLGVARHVELARLVVRPVRYDRRSGSWTAIRSAAVRVDFVGTDPGEAGTPIPPDFIDLRVCASIANPSALSASRSVGATASIPAPEPSVMTPVKIVTVEKVIHEIRRADLDAIGASVTGIDPGSFVLTHRGQEVGIEVVDGGDGSKISRGVRSGQTGSSQSHRSRHGCHRTRTHYRVKTMWICALPDLARNN